MMTRNSTVVLMLVISFLVIFLAVKQLLALREQVYWDTYLGNGDTYLNGLL